ncbi:transporter [Bacillus kexueae]|uniref:transporter n=1 Tax=Aeribacillus kexueae TaxID=2078952 RepID=UPI001FAFD3B5|nr:transporter [Bacillus kexueae]
MFRSHRQFQMFPFNFFPFPWGQPQQPPVGPPPSHGGGQHGGPPFGPPPGQGGQPGQHGGPPSGPPPSYIPPEPQGASLYAVDPGGIRGCLYRYTYIRLNNGRRFWYYPTYVGRTSVAGWRWRPRQYRWVYYGIDLSQIRSYSCS